MAYMVSRRIYTDFDVLLLDYMNKFIFGHLHTSYLRLFPLIWITYITLRLLTSYEIMKDTESDKDLLPSLEVLRLQLVLCQLGNSLVAKNRRKYSVLTQIISHKTHLFSSVYQHLLSMYISLPHSNNLQMLYSSFWLENEFLTFPKQSCNHFSLEQSHVVIRIDEIKVCV